MKAKDYKDHLFALILAGGGGTRLWPRSRNQTPKQFLKLFKNRTLTQITVERFLEILPMKKIYCVTVSEAYKKEILREVPGFLPGNIIVEPKRCETGPAHGMGAAYIYKEDPEAVIITESADRLVKPVRDYLDTVTKAAEMAFKNKALVALGVEPRYPHTGLGHIKKGKKILTEGKLSFYKVDKFVEKPDLKTAERYTKSGEYYWNAGQYVWRADSILEAFKKHAPKISAQLDVISASLGKNDEEKVINSSYGLMPKISIDYAVSEKARGMVVVAGDFYWTDIGDWKEVWGSSPKDNLGNVVIDGDEPGGEIINIDTSDALIHKDGRLIAVIDVDNIVIVDTKDALLVCSKSRAQNVKKIVDKLREENREELL